MRVVVTALSRAPTDMHGKFQNNILFESVNCCKLQLGILLLSQTCTFATNLTRSASSVKKGIFTPLE
eukprot:4151370-Pleurochrysis_carterae.AAC.2